MHGVVAFLLSFPLALSHNSHVVAHGDQSDFFASGGFVDVTHGLIAHLVTRFVMARETVRTPMPKATVEFVHGAGVIIVPVHLEGFLALTNHVFSSVASVTNVTGVDAIQVHQPFQGCVGIRFPALCIPTAHDFCVMSARK